MLSGTYNDDFEPMLLDNPREWIQVRGEAILAEDGTLKSLANITEIIEVDTSPVVIEGFSVDGRSLASAKPVNFAVEFVPEDGLYFATGAFHMMVSAELKDDLDRAVVEALQFLWREFANASPSDHRRCKAPPGGAYEYFRGGNGCRLNGETWKHPSPRRDL
ncbi:hypothetical protein [Bradyrhizobium sp. STM 3562]|uniref:hypothetical protein n=1 Tax=Bradyrhizobium sp. STM 3562 TaxID=578924 RepID=UPI00388ECEBE